MRNKRVKSLLTVVAAVLMMALAPGAKGQTPPQVFSPDAAELGKYGRTPVSYFTGVPSITVPLTSLKAKGYELPVYLTYHASGNRPDSHPGWVGLGWSLHAGGSITRVINGLKDEYSNLECNARYNVGMSMEPGYSFHTDLTQRQIEWADTTSMIDAFEQSIIDHQPDEFIVDIEDIHASFYIVGPDEVKIVSKGSVSFEVEYEKVPASRDDALLVHPGVPGRPWSFKARRYEYFKKFVITDTHGNRYTFGEDDSAIEYSVENVTDKVADSGNYTVLTGWTGVATANTWRLTKIERANGEVIDLSYEHDGSPIVKHVSVHGYRYDAPQYNGFYTHSYSSLHSSYEGIDSKSLYIVVPSYLVSIRSRSTGDTLTFSRSESSELGYDISDNEFVCKVGGYEDREPSTSPAKIYTRSDWSSVDHYCQLDSITGEGRYISFSHTADMSMRLRLLSVDFCDEDWNHDHSYRFGYNPVFLPAYNSLQTDLWGFYNGNDYSAQLSSALGNPDGARIPDQTLMKAEILESITYPTGGRTLFEFEPHRYSKVATQFPFGLETCPSDSVAGGLRIHRIIDISDHGGRETREFIYEGEDGLSSGILSGHPTNNVRGTIRKRRVIKFGLMGTEVIEDKDFYTNFAIFSDTPIRTLSETDGSHVTYSRVREVLTDGSFNVYEYTNHDEAAYRDKSPSILFENIGAERLSSGIESRSLLRGLLRRQSSYDLSSRLVRMVENSYRTEDTTDYVVSAGRDYLCGGRAQSLWYAKKLCSFPALTRRTITEYADDGTSVSRETTYQYNSERQLVSESTSGGGMTSGRMVFYPSDRIGETYAGMLAAGMSGVPVGEATLRNGRIVSARETTYRPVQLTVLDTTLTKYLPDRVYSSSFSSPLAPSAYEASPMPYMNSVPEMEFKKYDSDGNPVEIEEAGVSSEIGWDRNSNPAFIATGVRHPSVVTGDVYRSEFLGMSYLTGPYTVSRTFTTVGSSRNISLTAYPSQGYDWLFQVSLDGHEVGRVVSVGAVEAPASTWWGYLDLYTGSLSFDVPPGEHVVTVTRIDSWKDSGDPEEDGSPLLLEYYDSHQVTVGEEDIARLFDFEEDPASVSGGYQSDKAHMGLFTPGVAVPSDRRHVIDYRIREGDTWVFTQRPYTGPGMTVGTAGKAIDHVRIFPEDAGMMSYTWLPGSLLKSETDSRGVTVSYKYDSLGRLMRVRDNDGNPVSDYEYSYACQLDFDDQVNTVSEYTYLSPHGMDPRIKVAVFDGLGRPTREVLRDGGGPGCDIVTRSDYDLNGRPWHAWLPVAVNGNGVRIDAEALDESARLIYGDGEIAYSQTVYEPSPLDKVVAEIGPGAAWRDPARGVLHALMTNAGDPSSPFFYRGYTVDWDSNHLELVRNSAMSPSTMSVLSTTDEDGRVTLEFINPVGETVLVRQLADSAGTVMCDTHYVYDDMGRLAVVIPPLLSERLSVSGMSLWSESDISDLAYLYRYDSRGNCIAKLLPGGGWTYYVYDRHGRAVLSQDSVQGQSDEWSFSIADRQGRPVLSGTALMSVDPFSDQYRNADVYAVLPSSPSYGGPLKGYTLNGMSIQTPNVFIVNYYDRRCFGGQSGIPSDMSMSNLLGDGYPAAYTASACGMLTGSLTRILGEDGDQYLYSVPYYDARGQVVISLSSTHAGGQVAVGNMYDFEGKLIGSRIVHSLSPSSDESFIQDYAYSYDEMGRPQTSTLKISGQDSPSVIYSNSYDSIGRLISTGTGTTFSYNVRSWLTSISGRNFREELYYWDGQVPQYGGNVSSVSWTESDSPRRSTKRYDYSYDGLSRLTSARYALMPLSLVGGNFNEEYVYDSNGNITSLERRFSHNPFNRNQDLSLQMTYSGNQMSTVTDGGVPAGGFCYDAKGRQTFTDYGSESMMTYNAIDLPSRFVKDTTSVRWLYGADGTKLQVRTAKAQ